MYSDSFVPKSVSNMAARHLGQLYDPDINIDNYADILTYCDSFDIGVSDAQVDFVMEQTKAQSKSKLWFTMRAGRVTASGFHAACHTRIEKPAMSLLRAICSPNDQCFSSAATDWGKSNEAIARDAYVTSQHAQHSDFDCSDCGLFLNTQYPMFGATPDGLVNCTCCGVGVVEVKCPITLRDGNMSSLDWMVIESDGKFRLRKTHRHYYQVQMQLFVTNREYCDFVVWSPEMLYIERIVPDSVWWAEKSKQGMLFHAKCVMLCMKYFTTKSILVPSNAVIQSGNTSKHCICGGEDDGQKMICCDIENCCVQWYHVKCLKVKRVPRGKWFCPQCKTVKRK